MFQSFQVWLDYGVSREHGGEVTRLQRLTLDGLHPDIHVLGPLNTLAKKSARI